MGPVRGAGGGDRTRAVRLLARVPARRCRAACPPDPGLPGRSVPFAAQARVRGAAMTSVDAVYDQPAEDIVGRVAANLSRAPAGALLCWLPRAVAHAGDRARDRTSSQAGRSARDRLMKCVHVVRRRYQEHLVGPFPTVARELSARRVLNGARLLGNSRRLPQVGHYPTVLVKGAYYPGSPPVFGLDLHPNGGKSPLLGAGPGRCSLSSAAKAPPLGGAFQFRRTRRIAPRR